MRGEKSFGTSMYRFAQGSPPHARGKVQQSWRSGVRPGITPACAGKRAHRSAGSPRRGDHPRMRGEKGLCSPKGSDHPGSPPHARGKEPGIIIKPLQCGITPACAGKSRQSIPKCQNTWDHPRMRGEKRPTAALCLSQRGSPPHARGKACICYFRRLERGITPACAGKSCPTGR